MDVIDLIEEGEKLYEIGDSRSCLLYTSDAADDL